jgi:hypothetical protein
MPNELDQFLSDVENQPVDDILTQPLNPEPETPVQEEEEEEEEFKPKNRRERRQQAKLEAERQSAIDLAARLAKLEDARTIRDEEEDYIKGIERIYGTDTPEAQMATDLLKKAIVGSRDDAERRAYERIQAERQNETRAVQQAEEELDSIVDDIEDTYGVELTPAQETAYFELLQKMSPKDRSGNVISLADPHAVFEVFSDRLQKRGTSNPAKALAARSMVQPGSSVESTLPDDVVARQLRDMGII